MLAPGRSRTAASGRFVIATARSVAANGGDSSTRGCAVVAVAGTTWSSNSPIPVTRNASGTASFRFAVPEESFLMPISRSVPPGRSPRRLASAWSMTAAPAAEGPNIRPAVIFTRSPVTPSDPSGLANTCTPVSGAEPPAPGSAMLYSVPRVTDATPGSRPSAAKYWRRTASAARPPAMKYWSAGCRAGGLVADSLLVTMTVTCAAFAHASSRG